jgi:hypothetical protein
MKIKITQDGSLWRWAVVRPWAYGENFVIDFGYEESREYAEFAAKKVFDREQSYESTFTGVAA